MKLGHERTAADRANRRERFMPNGTPKWIRCYDNGGTDKPNGSIDRYTVVFTKAGCFMPERCHPVLAMSESPFSPQGFGQHLSYPKLIDRPTYGHLGKKIAFADLPPDCQKLVVHDYEDYWGISDRPPEEW